MRIPWRRLATAAVFLLALAFLVAMIQRQWAVLQSYQWQIAPGWALLALVGLELTWLYELDTWRMILRGLGGSLPYRRAAPIWFLSNIIRYIPGNIWQFLGMAELAADEGVPRMVTFTSIVLHQVLSVAAGIVLASLYFAVAGAGAWFAWLRPFLLLTPLGLFLLQPRTLERFLNWVMAKLHRPALRVTLTWGQIWLLLLRYLLVWLAMGLSFAALARSLTPFALDVVPYLVASWAAAYVIGFLSLLTPSGLGVREGILALLLTEVFAAPLPTVIAIVARLWMVLAELLAAGVALLVWRKRKPSTKTLSENFRSTLPEPVEGGVLRQAQDTRLGFRIDSKHSELHSAYIADQPAAEAGRATADLTLSAPDPAAACGGEVA